MSGRLPQIQPRDEDLQLRKLINQMRRNLPGPAFLRMSVQVDLLTVGTTLVVPANSEGWVTEFIDLFLDDVTGVQGAGADVSIGSNATFDNVAVFVNLGAGMVVNEQIQMTPFAPMASLTDPIYFDVQTAATGPSVLLATVYLAGYFR